MFARLSVAAMLAVAVFAPLKAPRAQVNSTEGGALIFQTNGTERARISDTAGNVGIGTTNPLAKLTVNGTISTTNAIQVGESALGCTAPISGSIRFNSTSDTLQVCTGSGWKSLASGTTAGTATTASSTGAIQFNSNNQLAGDTSNLYWDIANNRLGVGTNTPRQTLHVSGSFIVSTSAQDATSPSFYVDSMGRTSIGANTSAGGLLNIVSYTAAVASNYGIYTYIRNAPLTTPNAHYRGLYLINDYSSTVAATSGNSIRGAEFLGRNMGPGAISTTYGILSYGQNFSGVQGGSNYGVFGMASVSNATPVTNQYGLMGYAYDYNGTGVGGVSNSYSVYAQGYSNAGRTENYYGVFINNYSGVDPTGSFYGVYAADPAMENYFAGKTGVGTVTPIAKLDVTGDVSVSGMIDVGHTAQACSTAISGSIRYETTSDTIQVCTSAGWKSMVSSTSGAGASALSGLSDVNASAPDDKSMLVYSTTSSKWEAVSVTHVAFSAYGQPTRSATALYPLVNWPTVHVNDGNAFNATTGRFTAPVTGRYVFMATSGGNTTQGYMQLIKNNTTVVAQTYIDWVSGYNYTGSVQVVLDLVAGDYITSNLSANNIWAASLYTFSGYKIGPSIGVTDNLGDHIARQNIQTANYWISNDGGSEGVMVNANGNVTVGGTGTGAAKFTVNQAANATLTNLTQAIGNAAILLESNYVASSYIPGLTWYTTDNNATKPKAGVFLKTDGTGSYLYFGTSNSYATGITNMGTALSIDPTGYVGIGTADAATALEVFGTTSGTLITAGSGSVSAPGFGFSADGNTGFYRPAADVIALTINGAEEARIYSGGISATDLTVTGIISGSAYVIGATGSAVNGSIRWNPTANTLQVYAGGWQSLTSSTGGATIDGTGVAANVAYWTDANTLAADSGQLTWDATNNRLGIGTAAPNAALGVNGVISATNLYARDADTAAAPGFSWAADTNTGIYHPVADVIGISIAGAEKARIYGSGVSITGLVSASTSITFGSQAFGNTGDSAALPSFTWLADSNSGMFNAAADTIGFTTAGTESMRIDAAGNTSIGLTTTPAKLSVAGHLRLTGATSNTMSWGTTGVAAPAAGSAGMKLQLYGATLNTMATTDFALGIESSNMWLNAGGGYKIYSSGVLKAIIDSTGLISATTFRAVGRDTVSAPGHSWNVDTDTGMSNPYLDTIAISTAGAERMRVQPTGISASIPFYVSGSSGGFFMYDRSVGVGLGGLYRTGNMNYLWDTTGGNVLSYNSVGVGVGTGSSALTADLTVSNTLRFGGTASNTIAFGTAGAGVPGAGSAGMKINLYGATANVMGAGDYALGIESGTMWFNSGGAYKWYSSSVQRMSLDGSGNLTAAAFLYSSDKRLKENVKPITNALDSVEAMAGYSFSYISDTTHREHLGVMAQDVEKVYPQAVTTREDGFKAVDYPALVPVLLQAVKELKAQNEALRADFEAYKKQAGGK